MPGGACDAKPNKSKISTSHFRPGADGVCTHYTTGKKPPLFRPGADRECTQYTTGKKHPPFRPRADRECTQYTTGKKQPLFRPRTDRECTQYTTGKKPPISPRRMQCEARSCFAPRTGRECTTVHDRTGAEARQEIARNAPPPPIFSQRLKRLLHVGVDNFLCVLSVSSASGDDKGVCRCFRFPGHVGISCSANRSVRI